MCGRIVNLDTVARVLAEYYHLKTDTQLAALDEALSKVPAVSVGGGHGKDHVADPGKMVEDLISRRAAIDEIEYELEMINSALDSIALDFNARERLRQRRGEAREILNSIQQLPSAQPEIIRCKNCKYARLTSDGSCKYCDIWFPDEAEYMDGDYYCASAERNGNG